VTNIFDSSFTEDGSVGLSVNETCNLRLYLLCNYGVSWALLCVFATIDLLHQKDYAIRCLCDDKFNASLELLELFAKDELFGGVCFMPRFSFFLFSSWLQVLGVLEFLLILSDSILLYLFAMCLLLSLARLLHSPVISTESWKVSLHLRNGTTTAMFIII